MSKPTANAHAALTAYELWFAAEPWIEELNGQLAEAHAALLAEALRDALTELDRVWGR